MRSVNKQVLGQTLARQFKGGFTTAFGERLASDHRKTQGRSSFLVCDDGYAFVGERHKTVFPSCVSRS